jgi:hypothetical protein
LLGRDPVGWLRFNLRFGLVAGFPGGPIAILLAWRRIREVGCYEICGSGHDETRQQYAQGQAKRLQIG